MKKKDDDINNEGEKNTRRGILSLACVFELC